MSMGQSTIWILKPDSNNVLTIEAYYVSTTGQVSTKPFPVESISYDDGKMAIVTKGSDPGGVMFTITSYRIDWNFGATTPSGSGRYNITTTMPFGDQLLCAIGACGRSSAQDAGSGAISLSKRSDARVPPKSKPQPPTPSYSGSSAPMFPSAPMPFMMPTPMPGYTAPAPRAFEYTPQRNTSACMMNRHMCSNGCDPASYGYAKDYNRINSCRADCEQIYSRCMGQ
jgi:hypothetical protein